MPTTLALPADVVAGLNTLTARIAAAGGPSLDGRATALERAEINGFGPPARTSCGGACRLVPTADGWLAVSLPRESDVDLLPAWVGAADGWEDEVARRPAAALDADAAELGLAVAVPGSVTDGPTRRRPRSGCRERPQGPSGAPRTRLRVVDLSAMWAGPLCAWILGEAGAEVVKVEDPSRPDGARLGPIEFYERLHPPSHQNVVVELESPALRELLHTADVVIEGSRPRALEQLGIDREAIAADIGCVWVSITARGLDGPGRNRAGFGDDSAVAGGLVGDGPEFLGDALADPVTGLTAAALTLEALDAGGPWIVDAGLANCAAGLLRAA